MYNTIQKIIPGMGEGGGDPVLFLALLGLSESSLSCTWAGMEEVQVKEQVEKLEVMQVEVKVV